MGRGGRRKAVINADIKTRQKIDLPLFWTVFHSNFKALAGGINWVAWEGHALTLLPAGAGR
jgi:hypothetical protein